METDIKIGILALQGGYIAHQKSFEQLNIKVKLITSANQISDIDGLVIPGGESSTIIKLLTEDMISSIIDLNKKRVPIFGTCAGSILLAKTVIPNQFSFGFIDITAQRNAYGRQLDSFITTINLSDGSEIEAVFIRAPKFANPGKSSEILAWLKDDPILVRENNIIIASFHPELTQSTKIHKIFISMCKDYREIPEQINCIN